MAVRKWKRYFFLNANCLWLVRIPVNRKISFLYLHDNIIIYTCNIITETKMINQKSLEDVEYLLLSILIRHRIVSGNYYRGWHENTPTGKVVQITSSPITKLHYVHL